MARIEELIEQIKEYMGLVEEVPVKKKSNALTMRISKTTMKMISMTISSMMKRKRL